LTLIKPKWRFFGKKDPLRANFHKCFPSPHRAHGNTSFYANFVKFGRPEVGEIARYLMAKNKISARAPAPASARIAPKICHGQLQTIYSEFSKFHPNPFTSSGVIAERVNIVQTPFKRATKCLQYSAKLQLFRRVTSQLICVKIAVKFQPTNQPITSHISE